MKFPFFRTMLAIGALLVAWNCSDDSAINYVNSLPATAEDVKVLITADGYLYITESGDVKDAQGNVIGHLNEDGTITSNGEILIEGVNVDDLQTVTHYKTQDGQDYIVSEDNTAMDADGNVVGQFNPETGEIISDNGDVVVDVDGTSSDEGKGGNNENGDSGNGNGNGNQTGTSSASNGNGNQTNTSSNSNGNGNQTNTSSNSNGNNNTPTSSEVVTHQTLGDVTIDGAAVQTAQKNSAISKVTVSGLSGENDVTRLSWNLYWLDVRYNNGTYTIEGTVPDHFNDGSYSEFFKFDGHDFEFKLTVGAGSNNQNPNPGTSSSSKQQQTQSSSSKQQQTQSSASQQTTGCPTIEYVNGGASGSGFASRYWDGCKPHCSWPEHAHGNYSRQCTNRGKTENTNWTDGSICSGGSQMTCTSQIPFTVSGCSTIGFAFAAVPASNGGACGKCFELSFTGQGKYETKPSHQALASKKLIVMVTNVGTDVENGQFDIMIPGGGPGIFNATSSYGWGDQGKQYGGLLGTCEEQVGYNGDDNQIVAKRKECLVNKCNSSFSNDSEAKQGCLFLANFMESAGNPKHTYKEVKCPSVLSTKY